MSGAKKFVLGAAGAAGGDVINIEDVFSSYLYTGNGSSQTITNGIDLAGEGGAVIFKSRTNSEDWHTYDTARGVNKRISLNQEAGQYTGNSSYGLTAFNSNGFSVGSTGAVNGNGHDIAAYTFRKCENFFDIVTYTGNNTNRQISHNLGTTPGCIIVKNLDTSKSTAVYHRGTDSNYPQKYLLRLNATNQKQEWVYWGDYNSSLGAYGTPPTSTNFTVGGDDITNNNGDNYVAYLFAHHDGTGTFGETGDQPLIYCGSTGGSFENIGFEPEFVIHKAHNYTTDWDVIDTRKGFDAFNDHPYVITNGSNTEGTRTSGFNTYPNGFELGTIAFTHVFIAIRRGPMAPPSTASDFFGIDTARAGSTKPAWDVGFPVDMGFRRDITSSGNWFYNARSIQGNYFTLNSDTQENGDSSNNFDYMTGMTDSTSANTDYNFWAWRRGKGYFDVVNYKGNGQSNRQVLHDLGVAPEMIWVRPRNLSVPFTVYHAGRDETYRGELNSGSSFAQSTATWNDTAPTSSNFTVGNAGAVNSSGQKYHALLFATLAGISKVGSYTGTGSQQNIDCGFSNGAKFVLIKRDGPDDWHIFDTERGIVAGNDQKLDLNTSSSPSSNDWIDPYSSGFSVTSNSEVNDSGKLFMFYAIAT